MAEHAQNIPAYNNYDQPFSLYKAGGMYTQSQTTPDPDFSPSIPAKPDPAARPEAPAPAAPKPAGDDDLPVPPIFPTA